MSLPDFCMRMIGPFGFQENSGTRKGEYPWCYYATNLRPGMEVVEIGPGASGFQFALSQAGVRVTSVDPVINPHESVDWVFSEKEFQKLKRALRADVHFIRQYLQDAGLSSNTYDRVFSISVIEHIPGEEAIQLLKEAARILKPRGFFIATIDLFLDLIPFTLKTSNVYGANVSVSELVVHQGWTLCTVMSRSCVAIQRLMPNV